jgi:hypothetical protein
MKLEALEVAVLGKMLDGDHRVLLGLREQLPHLTVTSREHTGVGFFTHFAPVDSQAIPVPVRVARIFFGDVVAPSSPGLRFGAGFLILVENGILTRLEGYSNGADWPADVREIELEYRDPSRAELVEAFG